MDCCYENKNCFVVGHRCCAWSILYLNSENIMSIGFPFLCWSRFITQWNWLMNLKGEEDIDLKTLWNWMKGDETPPWSFAFLLGACVLLGKQWMLIPETELQDVARKKNVILRFTGGNPYEPGVAGALGDSKFGPLVKLNILIEKKLRIDVRFALNRDAKLSLLQVLGDENSISLSYAVADIIYELDSAAEMIMLAFPPAAICLLPARLYFVRPLFNINDPFPYREVDYGQVMQMESFLAQRELSGSGE